MKNFSSELKKLKKAIKRNPLQQSIIIGYGDKAWMMIHCPESDHYYAMSLASGKAIMSGTSAIRPAFRVDPKSGKVEKNPVNEDGVALLSHLPKGPKLFAIKVFSGSKVANKKTAVNELAALAQHHRAEGSTSPDGQPLIISDFYPGQTLCDTAGKPNNSLLHKLNAQDRYSLILQIANQYHEIHHHKEGKDAWIHTDVKGSNIIIEADSDGHKNAWVIDFGSAKKLLTDEVDESVATSLNGLTQNMVPHEAIAASPRRYVSLNEETGVVTRQSDVYALAPVFATLLGATDPYKKRRQDIRTQHGFDLQGLAKQVQQGFNLAGLFASDKCIIPGKLTSGNSLVAFANRVDVEAPNSKTILADETLPEVGCVLYKDQLLYIDKSRNKVINRRNTKPSAFRAEIENIKDIKSTDRLTKKDLFEVNKLLSVGNQDSQSLDDLVRPLTRKLLQQMMADDPGIRPTIDEVQRFFAIVNNLVYLGSGESNENTEAEAERLILIGLLQLNIIIEKGWNLKIPVNRLRGEGKKRQYARVSDFDFYSLMTDSDTFEKIGKVFFEREKNNVKEPLTKDDFSFLSFPSEKRRIFNAVVDKLGDADADLKVNIRKALVSLSLRDATEVISLPANLMRYIVSDDYQGKFGPDIASFDAYLRSAQYLEKCFPERYKSLQETFSPLEAAYPGFDHISRLSVTEQFSCLITATAIRGDVDHPKLVDVVTARVTSIITCELTAYLNETQDQNQNSLPRLSLFKQSDCTLGECRHAVTRLVDAVKSGEYDDLLQDRQLMKIYASKHVPDACMQIVNELRQFNRQLEISKRGQHV